MLKVFVFLSVALLFLGIFLVLFSDGNMHANKAGTLITVLNGKELSTRVSPIQQLDSLSAQLNLYFTEKNRNLIPKDLASLNR